MKKYRSLYLYIILVFAISSCTPAPAPTLIPIETVFAATHNALMAQTAAAKPRETAIPSMTSTRAPTPTPFPSATIVHLIATDTPMPTATIIADTPTNISSGSGTVLYACEIVQLTPADEHIIKPNEAFKWVWYITNVGTTKWSPDTVYARYVRGSQFFVDLETPLDDTFSVGETNSVSIKMRAPTEPGTYWAVFSLKKGIHDFCYAKLTIIVQK
ncbi:MAG: hypothetical protein HN392_00060 [Anaerolineae bacterium]|jgi:hypothetical protein|nr:hypothetical protein [Anaerolineae bacterium]MBT7073581.1 hypothetical protein [Anaerolineae bacterium]MBT7781629.1 hypothetical protein [Anaerolineae bacterium]